MSDNDRRWWSNDHAAHVPYRPQDNAESFAARLLPGGKDPRDPQAPEVKFQGGPFVADGYVPRR